MIAKVVPPKGTFQNLRKIKSKLNTLESSLAGSVSAASTSVVKTHLKENKKKKKEVYVA